MASAYETIPCPICRGTNFFNIYKAAPDHESRSLQTEDFRCTAERKSFHQSLVRCQQCSFVFINPRPVTDFLRASSESVEDEIYAEEKEGRARTYAKAIDLIEKRVPNASKASYLDLSCYMGFFVESLRQKQRQVEGVDICYSVVEEAQKRFDQRLLKAAPVAQWPQLFSGRRFDVVTSWDAIEHVDDLDAYLSAAAQLTKKDGRFFVSTMNYRSLFARITGKRWPWLMPMHLYYFTPETLEKALERHGFKVLYRTTYPHVVSLGYLLYKIHPRLFGGLRKIPFFKNRFVSVDLGDFMTIEAQRISDSVSPSVATTRQKELQEISVEVSP